MIDSAAPASLVGFASGGLMDRLSSGRRGHLFAGDVAVAAGT